METLNHEYYVSIEIAKLLEKAGFDWKCHGIYVLDSENDPEYVFSTANFTNTSKEIEGYIRLRAPTLDVAQRWLREVKNISVDISSTKSSNWEYVIRKINQLNYKDNTILVLTACKFYTYEEAKKAGIKNALEMILEKGE